MGSTSARNTLIKSPNAHNHLSPMLIPLGGDIKVAPNCTARAVAMMAAGSSNSPWGRTKALRNSRGLYPIWATWMAKKKMIAIGAIKRHTASVLKENIANMAANSKARTLLPRIPQGVKAGNQSMEGMSSNASDVI